MKEKYLPIGTVVKLNGGMKKLMITGYCSKSKGEGKIYTYNACIFPEGLMENVYSLFNANQIEEVCYKGLENDEFEDYINRVNSDVGISLGGSKVTNDIIGPGSGRSRRRTPKPPTKPLSSGEMRDKYTSERLSGNQTEKFDFDILDKR